jgi:hypothetical protein
VSGLARRAAWGIVGTALVGAAAGCNLLIGLQGGLPEGSGGASSSASSTTASGSGGGSPAASISSSSGACTRDAGTPSGCDRTWAHWNTVEPSAFVDEGDGTVKDTTTKLLWQKEYAPMLTRSDALAYCEQLTLAGHCDWRLPTRIELSTLVDYGSAGTLLVAPVFGADGGTDPSGYWTASSYFGDPTKAWAVHFGLGLVFPSPLGSPLDVRCVR